MPVGGNLSRARFRFHHRELVAGLRSAAEAKHLDRNRRAGFRDLLAAIVDQRANLAPSAARDNDIANAQRAALDQHRANRAAPVLEHGLDDDAFRLPVRVGLELQNFRLQQNRFQELVEIGLLGRRHLDFEDVAAHAFDDHLVVQKVGAHALRVRVRLVDLVDGNDHRYAGCLGVIDSLDGLRLDAVIGRDHQDDEVGHLRAARAHRRKGLVARRVDERHLLAVDVDLVGTDMLGNAAGLAGATTLAWRKASSREVLP